MTSTLADRDKVIGSLIDNLNEVLDHIGDRDDQLTQLIQTYRTFVGGLKDDRQAILGSLDQISQLSVQTADLVSGIREPFVDDIKQLRSVAGTLDANKSELDRALQVLPIKLNKVGRTAIYGSWRGGTTTRTRVDVAPTLATSERSADLVDRTAAGARACSSTVRQTAGSASAGPG